MSAALNALAILAVLGLVFGVLGLCLGLVDVGERAHRYLAQRADERAVAGAQRVRTELVRLHLRQGPMPGTDETRMSLTTVAPGYPQRPAAPFSSGAPADFFGGDAA